MTGESTTYAFANYGAAGFGSRKPHHTRRSRRGSGKSGRDESDAGTDDGTGSLTYSAASSVNSGGSSGAGQSTDSSFADIMKVLDLEDRDELSALMKKEAFGEYKKVKKKETNPASSSAVSVTSSLAYSTDQSSALGGEALLQIITGQPSDGYGPDGGGILGEDPNDSSEGFEGDNMDILFAPANPFDKNKKKKKKGHRKSKSNSSRSSAKEEPKNQPQVETPVKQSKPQDDSYSGDSSETPTPTPASPPSTKPRMLFGEEAEDEEAGVSGEDWFGKWWMCGFADAWRDLIPKF